MKQQEYITPQQARVRSNWFRQVGVYKPITLIKKVFGYGMIGVGVATSWFPSGSVFVIMGGCALVSIDYKKILSSMGFYGVRAYGWAYSHRTKKLRSYYRHLRRLK